MLTGELFLLVIGSSLVLGLLGFCVFGKRVKRKAAEKPSAGKLPLKVHVSEALKDSLRARLEKSILINSMIAAFKAEARGELTAEEREKLVKSYEIRFKELESESVEGRSRVGLGELKESLKELIGSLSRRMGELTRDVKQVCEPRPFRASLGSSKRAEPGASFGEGDVYGHRITTKLRKCKKKIRELTSKLERLEIEE